LSGEGRSAATASRAIARCVMASHAHAEPAHNDNSIEIAQQKSVM